MDINSNAVLLLIMAAVLNGVPLLYGTRVRSCRKRRAT